MFPFTPRRSSGSLTNNCSTNTELTDCTCLHVQFFMTVASSVTYSHTDWPWSGCPWCLWWASGDKWGCLFGWTGTALPRRGRGKETDRWASRTAARRMTTSPLSCCTSAPAGSENHTKALLKPPQLWMTRTLLFRPDLCVSPPERCSPVSHRKWMSASRPACSPYTCQSLLSLYDRQSPAVHYPASDPCRGEYVEDKRHLGLRCSVPYEFVA